MINIKHYIDEFFENLEVWEDINEGKTHNKVMKKSILRFIDSCTVDNAFHVYRQFFSAYSIGTQSEDNDFLELIEKMRKYEENAGMLLTKHRDHYVHSVYVFIIGLSIFSQNKTYRDTVANAIKYEDSYSTKNEEFFYRWGIAALFHDIAYPMEITIKHINEYINFVSLNVDLEVKLMVDHMDAFNHLPKLDSLPQFLKEFTNKYHRYATLDLTNSIDLLSDKISQCFITDKDKIAQGLNDFVNKMQNEYYIDHGYYGALIVLRWYYYLIQKENWNPVYFYFPIVDAASAILMHNYYKYGLMNEPFNFGILSVEQHPLAYLLILSDEIQDWNRQSYGTLDANGDHPTGFDVNISNDKLKVIYEMSNRVDRDMYIKNKQYAIASVLKIESLFKNGIAINYK